MRAARVARIVAVERAPADDRWLSAKEAASVLGVSTRTLYQFCRRGELRHARITMNRSGVMRFRRSWLDAFMGSTRDGTVVVRAALYARVSTADQTCENQLLELRTYAIARGWTILEA